MGVLNKFLDSFFRLIDRFIHPEVLRSADRWYLRRYRVAVGSVLIGFIPASGMIIYQVTNLELSSIYSGLMLSQIGVMSTMLTLFRYLQKPFKLLYFTASTSVVVMYLTILVHEPVGYSTFLWLQTTMVLISFMIGVRWGWFLFFTNSLVCYLSLALFGTHQGMEGWMLLPLNDIHWVTLLDTVFSSLFLMTICSAFEYIELKSEQELSEKQKAVMQSHEALIRASKFQALGEMAGEIAHEINNPLTIIMAHAEVLDRELKKAPLREGNDRASKIHQTAARIDKIVKGLLSFARKNSPKDACDFNPIVVLQEALEVSAQKLKSKRIKLELNVEVKHLQVYGSTTQLGQVFLNLLSNAIDAIDSVNSKNDQDASRWIRIRVFQRDRRLVFGVANSGPEIAEEQAVKILEPFYTTKPPGSGNGLGLSISKGIAEAMGGRLILVERFPVCFELELPFLPEGGLASLG